MVQPISSNISGKSGNADSAFKSILRMASMSEQSSSHVRDKLTKAGYSDEVIEVAIDKAVDCHVIDDERYADQYARSKLASGKGVSGIFAHFERMGIDSSGVEALQEACDLGEDAEIIRALHVLNKKPPRSKNIREGAYRKLVQMGYSSSVASQAARRWCEQSDLEWR